MKNEFVVYVLQELGAAQQDKLGSYSTIKKARAAIARAIKMRKLMTQSSRAIKPPPQGALECYARSIGINARLDKSVFLIVGPPPAQQPKYEPQPVVPIPISVRFAAITDRQQGFEAELAALAADVRAIKQALASLSARESARVLFENGQPGATPVPALIGPPPGPVADRRVSNRREVLTDEKRERVDQLVLELIRSSPGINRTSLEVAFRKRMGAGHRLLSARIDLLAGAGRIEVRSERSGAKGRRTLRYYLVVAAEKRAEAKS